jgi:hypothetical protein
MLKHLTLIKDIGNINRCQNYERNIKANIKFEGLTLILKPPNSILMKKH